MASLQQLVDANGLLQLPPEEIAWYVLESVRTAEDISPYNICLSIGDHQYRDHPNRREMRLAVAEALSVLIRDGLLVLSPSQANGWYALSRRAKDILTRSQYLQHRRKVALPVELLHPVIQEVAYPIYLQGHNDAAVFDAFKKVEIAVREASGVEDDGVRLMRQAFRPVNDRAAAGRMIDPNMPANEQEGLMSLFVAAVLWCRNPVGHRAVEMPDDKAAQLLIHASYLLSLVDELRQSAVIVAAT